MIRGVRFAPAGVNLSSRACPPFSMDPDRATRARLDQRPLTAAVALAMQTALPLGNASWCSVSACSTSAPLRIFHMTDVCVHNDDFFLLSDRDTEPVTLVDDWYASPKHHKTYKRTIREVRSEAGIPGQQVWLKDSWMITSPKFRFGHGNIFHAILEEIGWLGRATTCGKIATAPDMNYILLPRRHLLGRSPTGRLWEIAAEGASSYYMPKEQNHSICFRRLHFDTTLEPVASAASEASCAHVGALHAKPPEWPGWPAAREKVFPGFDEIVSRARVRVGLAPEHGDIGGRYATPRVTVVHRLKNRRLLNIEYVAWILRDEGFHVTVVSLECLPLEAQLALVSNSSTLLGVHGAGMTLGHALPPDALVIELRTAPCTEEARGIPYQMRHHSRIIPAPAVAVMPNASCPPPWKYNKREYDAVVDIDAVLRTIYEKDPIAIASRRPRPWWMLGKPRPVRRRLGAGGGGRRPAVVIEMAWAGQ
mmetsp:Transcript_18878/g.47038  ORF Transcript_18878/g.47038 Transcript_18878/m.47038 type:complete len:479 (+) Transcript_18878:1817-3253(+)